jgi:hypothetical protein
MQRSTYELLVDLRRRGVRVTVEGPDLVLTPGKRVPSELIPELRRRKPEILLVLDLERIDPEDRDTWPEYLRRLERISREQFGEEAAQRQVQAEMAFLATAEARGWTVVPDGLGETEKPS